ncbi:MAG: pyridoxal phosphate-dependent aminotransferase [Clostridia bacterium]|nr:pyridoxal phosphate-dependent aminotransferase [Clostridia bacterium]
MVSQIMAGHGKKRSVIREIFEYSKARSAQIGAENVFDFSLGNPSVPAPACVNETIRALTNGDSVLLHGYTSAQGDAAVREKISDYLNSLHGCGLNKDLIYMTCGAAASLTITIKALTCDGDEFITFAPFFPEYRVFTQSAGATLKVSMPRKPDFQPDIADFESLISENTKGVIINSPNNPSGVVYSEESIKALCAVLDKKQREYGHPIYLITDEPYRELVYGSVKVPFVMNYYNNTIVCYSFSKALSLPGERIGYIAVSPNAQESGDVYAAVCGAGRCLGYVCAPSMMQYVIKECIGAVSDISVYEKNRNLLYDNLTEMGYECVRPDGAFYLFVKALEDDAYAFCEKAKQFELLLVPGDDFGTPGYIRIAYCVSTERIEKSLPAFKALADLYKK